MANRQIKPILLKRGVKLETVALGEPSLTLLDSDFGEGFLLAESCKEDGITGALCLEHVHRVWYRFGAWDYPEFQEVALETNEEWDWQARGTSPSGVVHRGDRNPYCVQFISSQEYREFSHWLRSKATPQIIESVKGITKFNEVIGISLARWRNLKSRSSATSVRISLPPKPKRPAQ